MSNIKDLADPNVDRVLIYAGDGGCYWRQNGCGYTYAHTAGVFTRAEAYALAGHCGPEKRIELHSVPDDHVPTLQAENAALRTAAAEWQALAEERQKAAVVFLGELVVTADQEGEDIVYQFGRLRDRDAVIEAVSKVHAESPPAAALAAHDREVRAKALREAAGTMGVQAPIRTSPYDDFGSGREKGFEDCIEILVDMADEAEKEVGNA
jgi:hypothetical protein